VLGGVEQTVMTEIFMFVPSAPAAQRCWFANAGVSAGSR
jgi:hypothetical protein